MREAEGAETPSPGKSLERAWSKHREPDIRNVEAEVRVLHLHQEKPRSPGWR